MSVTASYGFRPHRSRLPTSAFALALYPCCPLTALRAVPTHTLISLFSVRSFVVQSVDRGPFGRCSRSIPSHFRTYLSLIVSGIPLCTNLTISPTVQYRRGSVAFVLALVVVVQLLAVRREVVRSRQSPILAAAAGIDPARSPSRPWSSLTQQLR